MLVNEARIRQLINLIGQQHYPEELKTLAADLERRLLEGRARLAQLSTSRNLEGECTCSRCAQRFVVPTEHSFREKPATVAHSCPHCGAINRIGQSQ
jgi:RNase P subunit RPR2